MTHRLFVALVALALLLLLAFSALGPAHAGADTASPTPTLVGIPWPPATLTPTPIDGPIGIPSPLRTWLPVLGR